MNAQNPPPETFYKIDILFYNATKKLKYWSRLELILNIIKFVLLVLITFFMWDSNNNLFIVIVLNILNIDELSTFKPIYDKIFRKLT